MKNDKHNNLMDTNLIRQDLGTFFWCMNRVERDSWQRMIVETHDYKRPTDAMVDQIARQIIPRKESQ